MRTTHTWFLMIPLVWTVASTQELPALNGSWRAEFIGPNGGSRAAELTIAGQEGTWKDFTRGGQRKNNPCLGPEFPVAIRLRSTDEITIHVSEARLQGCADIHATFKLVDAKTLVGTFHNGTSIAFVRH